LRKRYSVNEFGYPDVWKYTRLIINRLGRTIIHNNNKTPKEKTLYEKEKPTVQPVFVKGFTTQNNVSASAYVTGRQKTGL